MADLATLNGVADASIASINGVTTKGGSVNGLTWPAPLASISFVSSSLDTSNGPSWTFSSHAIGAPAANRTVIVAVTAFTAAATSSSLTIGGVSATSVVSLDTGNGFAEIWQADVPTGTTGDIVVTFSGTGLRHCEIGVYAAYAITATKHDSGTHSGTASLTTDIAIPVNSVVVGVCYSEVTNATSTWVGVTERYDALSENTAAYHGGDGTFSSSNASHTVSCTLAGAGGDLILAAASWGTR